jgi:hypothetical protein
VQGLSADIPEIVERGFALLHRFKQSRSDVCPRTRVERRNAHAQLFQHGAQQRGGLGIGHDNLPPGDAAEDNPHLEPAEPASSRSAIEFVRNLHLRTLLSGNPCMEEDTMDGLIYLIGLIVVIMAILSFFGLR